MRALVRALTLASCCLILPSAASAATVGLSDDGSRFVFRSGHEASDMIIRFAPGVGFEVPYTGGALIAGPGCVPGPPVTCDAFANWDITLGSGDDRSKGPGAFLVDETVDAGPGDDEVYANGQRNTVTTGSGDDVGIINSNARSTLAGNAGDDRLAGTDQGGAVIDGGPGHDIVAGQNIDSNVLAGGPGADTIVSRVPATSRFGGGSADGGSGADVISVPGNGPRDTYAWTLTGGTGSDTIIGSPGTDAVSGGTGNDTIDVSGAGPADSVSCGPGRDVVHADADDEVAADCERVLAGPLDPSAAIDEALAAADAFVAQLRHLNTTAFGPLLGD